MPSGSTLTPRASSEARRLRVMTLAAPRATAARSGYAAPKRGLAGLSPEFGRRPPPLNDRALRPTLPLRLLFGRALPAIVALSFWPFSFVT